MINNTNLVVIIEPANSRKQNINFNLSSPLYQTIETHTHTHTHTRTHTNKLGLTLKNASKLSDDSWKQFLLSYLSYHRQSPEVCFCLDLGKGNKIEIQK